MPDSDGPMLSTAATDNDVRDAQHSLRLNGTEQRIN